MDRLGEFRTDVDLHEDLDAHQAKQKKDATSVMIGMQAVSTQHYTAVGYSNIDYRDPTLIPGTKNSDTVVIDSRDQEFRHRGHKEGRSTETNGRDAPYPAQTQAALPWWTACPLRHPQKTLSLFRLA